MNAFLTPGWHRSLWLRRIAAVSLVILAATLSLTRKDPTVVTLSRTVSAGETLAPSDFSRTSVPQSLIPDNAVTDDTEAHGNVAVTTLSRGQILTSTSYTGEGITPAGLTSVPLRLADPATSELLKHGDSVTIVAGDGSIVCEKATVILPRKDTVLVAMDSDLAPAVASATLNGPVTVVVRSAVASVPAKTPQ